MIDDPCRRYCSAKTDLLRSHDRYAILERERDYWKQETEGLRRERDQWHRSSGQNFARAESLEDALEKALARAEAAEAELRIHRERAANLNNMWRHEFSREVEAAADKLFARMAWPHKEIRALAQGGNDG